MNATPDQSPQHLTVAETPNATVVTIMHAEINENQLAAALTDELTNALKQANSKNIVVDMKHVVYITSVAMLPFIMLRKSTEASEGRTVLCNLSDGVARVLTVSQLIVESRSHVHHMQMAADLDAALKMVGESPE